jgi:hypothetical protein
MRARDGKGFFSSLEIVDDDVVCPSNAKVDEVVGVGKENGENIWLEQTMG